MSRTPRARLAVLVILIVAVGLRIGEIERVSYKPIFDAGSYLDLARQITVSGDYSASHMNGNGAGRTHGPSAYFPPGFPYYLAAVDALDGASTAPPPPGHSATFSHTTVRDARFAQLVPEMATVILIGLIALECFGATTALVALGLAALDPVLIELTGVLVAENLFTALILAAIYAALRVRRAAGVRRRYLWILAAGCLTGLASLTHVNGIVLIVPVAAAVSDFHRRSPRALIAPAVLVLAAVLTVLPWTIRNAVTMHRFIPISDETGMTLVGTYNAASAQNPKVPYKWRYFAAIPGEHPLYQAAKQMNEATLESRLQRQAIDYVDDHPLAPLNAAGHNLVRMFELEGSYAWKASAAAIGLDSTTARIGVIGFWVLSVLALFGVLVPVTRRAPRWLWAVPVLLALSVILVNVETPRFREPVDPFLILLAACLIGSGIERLGRDRPKPLHLAPGGIVLSPVPGGIVLTPVPPRPRSPSRGAVRDRDRRDAVRP